MNRPGYPRHRRFLAELKRRHVFKVAAVYGATAFVVLQLADIVFPSLGVPAWAITLIVALALAGFPLALVLAWAFEMTPGGVRKTDPATTGELEAIAEAPRAARWPIGILALVATVLLVGGGWWVLRPAGSDRPATYSSIAVLPFADLSGLPENEYFGDGLAEELLNALASIEKLKVAARTSAFAFRGRNKDVREIGQALDVETVLEGSVRRSGRRLRITAQLIDAGDGYHIWSESYERELTDIFALQDEIARSIVDALAVPLGAVADRGLYLGGTDDLEAYDHYLRGRQRWATRQVPALRHAVADFEAAIARDSSFALAWSGLADAIDALAYRVPEAVELVPRGIDAARRAIALEPELAEAHASLGVLLMEFERDWDGAERALQRAIALKPSYASARLWYGSLLRYQGRPREGVEHHRVAAELDPLSPTNRGSYSTTLVVLGRWDEAREQYARSELATQDVVTYGRGLIYGRQLDLDREELAYAAERWARGTGFSEPAAARVIGEAVLDPASRAEALDVLARLDAEGAELVIVAGLTLMFGERESSLERLERALAIGSADLVMIGVDPTFDPLRDDPRFQRIIAALDLPNGYDPARDR